MAVGIPSLASPVRGITSKRSSINVNFVDFIYDYQFINHIQVAFTGVAPVATFWFTSGNQVWNSSILDANGWANNSVANGNSHGNHILVPSSSDYSTYVIKWDGRGTLTLGGTWTETFTSGTGYAKNSNGNWSGKDITIEATYSGAASPAQLAWRVTATDPLSAGDYFRNLKIYRKSDETDLLAGKIFRSGYKQQLVTLNPSVIRFMNWTGANDAQQCRFENRAVPTYATYGGVNPRISPPYGETTGVNQMTLASASGMPVAMQHGEIVQTRFGSGIVRGGAKTISAITKANPGVVTATAHGFSNGDKVIPIITAGMTQLDHWQVTATVIDADNFSIGVDTTSFTTFTAGTVMEYISLNVGARGEYPVIFTDGITPASNYSNNYLRSNDYRACYFDKTIAASRDGSGNLVYGAWMIVAQASNSYLPYTPNVPLEICTALVNEVNDLALSQGVGGQTDMWICIPHMAMLSMDPDYTAASNPAIGAVNVVLNGANGFSGLRSRCNLLVEYSNETWNLAASAPQTTYLSRRGVLRDSVNGSGSSYMAALRSTVMVKDIKTVFGGTNRVKYVLSGQGTIGIANGSTNYNRAFGATAYNNDVLYDGTSPIAHHDIWAWAAYLLAGPTYDGANLATLAAAWVANAGNPTAQEANCATYVTNGVFGSGYSETVSTYQNTRLPEYAASMVGAGKLTCMYEGGWDKTVTAGTSDVNNFLIAVKKSQAWSDTLAAYFDAFNSTAGAFMPADYIQVDQRWGHTYQDTYSGGVEGGGLDKAWLAAGTRNRGLIV